MPKHYMRQTYVAEIADIVETEGNRAWLEELHFLKDSTEYQIMIGAPEYLEDYASRVETLLARARELGCSVSFLNIIVIASEHKACYLRFLVI